MNTAQSQKTAFWNIYTKLAVFLAIAYGTATITQEIRITRIESNRFTDQDSRDLEDRITKKFPLEWLIDDVKEIKGLVQIISRDVISLDKKVSNLESRVRALENK